jgi:DNA-binding transcriptional ArsR family regulator
MELYQNKYKKIVSWLYFYLKNAQGDIFLEYNLPAPNYVLHSNRDGVFIGWQVNGYPGTQKAQDYFNDIIARFIIGFKEHKPERLPYEPHLDNKYALKDTKHAHELKQFQNLPSLYWLNEKKIWSAESVGTIDQVFWAIKIYTEELIKEFGESIPVPYSSIEDYTFRNFFGRKDNSTLKAKCRSVWNWYDKRGWTIPKRRNFEMTRTERAKKNAELKYQRARATLLGFIKGNLLANEYKKKDGSWNITKLSKAIKLDPKTIRNHLKELKEEKII